MTIGFSTLFNKFIHDINGGSLALSRMLNDYIYIVIREIYCSEGDILKFSGKRISFKIKRLYKQLIRKYFSIIK